MKKNRKHKWKYQVNIRKKILVLVILGVFLFVGLGFAILEANLSMHGTIEVAANDKTLYGVFLKEYNNGYAERYTGAHQDSMDASKSTEDIYHFYATDNDSQAEVVNRNNVVFAGMCWELIRTTDTGGVRLLYKGDPEEIEVNGETRYNCGSTRNRYHVGGIESTYDLGGNKLYAKNYTATTNGSDTTFTLVDDPDDPDDTYTVNINNTNAEEEISKISENYPYTCMNTSKTCTNENFYKVGSQNQNTRANVYRSTIRKSAGRSAYNNEHTSVSFVGYKYGDVYYKENLSMNRWEKVLAKGYQSILYSEELNVNWLFAHSVDWNNQTAGRYTLENPYTVSSTTDYPNLVGEYTYSNNNANQYETWVQQIIAVDNTTMYYKLLLNGETLSSYEPYVLGDALIDNGNGTYTIDNPVNLTHADWYRDYANYVGYYTCGNSLLTCSNPIYIYETNKTGYHYIQDYQSKITIATGRNGLVLTNPITISIIEWFKGYNTTYKDYNYTCGNTSTTCTETNLRYIQEKQNYGYYYSLNRYFGNSVIYEDNKYKLQNTIELEDARDLTKLATHHYVCLDQGVTECSQVAYMFYYERSDNAGYVLMQGVDVLTSKDILENALTKNTTDSLIKQRVDKWYELKLKDTPYEAKLDDTIYCNNRSFNTTGNEAFNKSAWNPNGGSVNAELLTFKERNSTKDLSCENITDRFSVSNSAAQLNYKVALITAPELDLLFSTPWRTAIEMGDELSYYTMSPSFYAGYDSHTGIHFGAGGVVTTFDYWHPPTTNDYVRPAISLIKDTKYSSGDGSVTNPYIVDMSN